jgi:hypothetical protein
MQRWHGTSARTESGPASKLLSERDGGREGEIHGRHVSEKACGWSGVPMRGRWGLPGARQTAEKPHHVSMDLQDDAVCSGAEVPMRR